MAEGPEFGTITVLAMAMLLVVNSIISSSRFEAGAVAVEDAEEEVVEVGSSVAAAATCNMISLVEHRHNEGEGDQEDPEDYNYSVGAGLDREVVLRTQVVDPKVPAHIIRFGTVDLAGADMAGD